MWQAVQWLWPILGPTIVAIVVAGLGYVLYGLLWGLLLALIAALVAQVTATLKIRKPPNDASSIQSAPVDTGNQSASEPTEPEFPGDEMGTTITQWTDTHPWIKKDEMDSDPIRRRSIHIADFALRRHAGDLRGFVLKEKTFDDCHIYGPAILAPLATGEVGGKTFVRCQHVN